ncbi:MAG TPA: arsenate reductase ArsC [Myxococcales bacterium]|nr:arsenate reductase ArsC [Myxococcales bacterium]
MKTVVFASVHDAARCKMAAAFFNAFTMPSLVRAVSGGVQPLLWVPPEIVQAMREVGLDAEGRPHLLQQAAVERATLVVTFAGAGWEPPQGVPHEIWDVPDPSDQPLERIREIRDRLRTRVWRLVAQRGWYRLQPSLAVRPEPAQHA